MFIIWRPILIQAMGPRLYSAMQKTGGKPILHFSAHGNQDGIQLTNGKFVTWEVLRNLIVPINRALNGVLLVSLSSCESFSACRMAMTENEDVPFFALVANTGKPKWNDSAVAFVTFYHHIFKGNLIPVAVNAMKVASGDNNFQSILGVQARHVWLEHIQRMRQQEAQERIKKMIEEYRENLKR